VVQLSKLKASIFSGTSFAFMLTSASLLTSSPSSAFTINSSDGHIEFSVRPVLPVSPEIRDYDNTTIPNISVKDALLTPSRGYPLISELSPLQPVQTKDGVISPPLSDVWTVGPSGKGTANIQVEAIARSTVAGIGWTGNDIFLNDVVNDSNAVRNASLGSASFTTTVKGDYTELANLNVKGGIYLNPDTDAWVTGSIVGKFNDAAKPHTLEILFGYDGVNRGREDFITAFLDGIEQTSGNGNFTGSLLAGEDIFRASGLLLTNDFFGLDVGDTVSVEGTFSCVAFNGYCGGTAALNPPEVPEPSSILSTLTTAIFGAGLLLKRNLNKKKPKQINFDVHSSYKVLSEVQEIS
jgi:hypothetical protein